MSEKQSPFESLFNERTCARCGKRFIAQIEHIFKKNGMWYCSWTCYNHRHDTKEQEKKEK